MLYISTSHTLYGKWHYQYRAVDKHGKTLDFILSERRDEAAARAFFIRTIESNGLPVKVVIDKSSSNLAGLNTIKCCLLLCGWWQLIAILRLKYLNNFIEQPSHGLQTNPSQVTDHQFIKKLTRPKGFKSFHSASSTLQGIEVSHMIRNKIGYSRSLWLPAICYSRRIFAFSDKG